MFPFNFIPPQYDNKTVRYYFEVINVRFAPKSGHIDDGSSTSIVDQKVEGFDTYVG
jgi:hypothetical protein